MSQLARQLSQLQTEIRVGKGRASLLFHAREAEEHDLHTIYDIGCNGFAEVAQLNPLTADFSTDLFGPTWKELDRDTQDAATNAAINSRISAFLRVLAPHMLSRAAHKCLEYLIRRFKVHVYNIDALLEAALPFHESTFFGRLVQILELSSACRALGPGSATVGLWHFLSGCKATGAPLTRAVLVKQCLKDAAVLRFICDAAVRAVSAGSEVAATAPAAASSLKRTLPLPIVALFGITAVDVLVTASSVSEGIVSTLLPTVVRALRSGPTAPEFLAAACTVAAALCRRASFTVSPWDGLVRALCTGSSGAAGAPQLVATLGAMFAGQAALQHWQGSPGPSPETATEAGGSGGRKWLATYLIPGRALSLLLAVPGFSAALSDASARHDLSALLRCLTSSCVAHMLAQPAEALAARTIIVRLPQDALRPLVPGLTRHILSRFRLVWRLQQQQGSPEPAARVAAPGGSPELASQKEHAPTLSIPDPAAATEALALLLRALAQQYPDSVDTGLGVLVTAPVSRAGSGGASILAAPATWTLDGGTALPASAAVVSASSESDAVAKWAAAVLCGTSHTQVASSLSSSPTSPERAQSERSAELRLSLTLALAHPSATVRLSGARAVDELATAVLAAAASSSNTSSAFFDSVRQYHRQQNVSDETERSRTREIANSIDEVDGGAAAATGSLDAYVSVAKALRQCLSDADASVVRAAIAIHRRFLAAPGVVVVTAVKDLHESTQALLQNVTLRASEGALEQDDSSQALEDDGSEDGADGASAVNFLSDAALDERRLACVALQLLRVVRRWTRLGLTTAVGSDAAGAEAPSSTDAASSQAAAARFLRETSASAAAALVSEAMMLVTRVVLPALVSLPQSSTLTKLQRAIADETTAVLLDMLPIGAEAVPSDEVCAAVAAMPSAALPSAANSGDSVDAVSYNFSDVKAAALACAVSLGGALGGDLFPLFSRLRVCTSVKVSKHTLSCGASVVGVVEILQ